MSGIETSKLHLERCFNPQGKNVNINQVLIGCSNINESKLETRYHTGEGDKPEDSPNSQISELQGKIESALKDRYSEIMLPSLPWLDETDVDVPIEKYTTLQLQSENEREKSKIIDLKNLFDNISKTPDETGIKKNPRRRILIESQPGFGKTTLVHKIASDWSKGIQYVKHFRVVIVVILREYAASTLQEELKDVIGVKNCDNGDFWKVVNTDETLLLFDGLDEISGQLRRDIQEILHDNKEEYKMMIVTTCRVGLSVLKRSDSRSMHRGVSLKKAIWDKRITILGINEVNQSEFLEKFVDENDRGILMPRLAKIIATRKRMFNSPLLLILLVYVTSENHDVKIDTDTDLYKALVDCIIRRSVDKINPEIACVDFTLFASCYNEPIFDDCKKKFIRFGEICLDHILTDVLQFEDNIKNEAVHQMGFLIKHVTKKPLRTIIRYEGFHLSILEFAAAVSMAHYFATNDNRFRPEDIHKLFIIIRNKRLTSMVLPFLCDLLGNGIAHLIEELSRYYIFFWFNEVIVEFLFKKCFENGFGGEHFVKIIPPCIRANTFRSTFAINSQNLAQLLVVELDDIRYLRNIHSPTHLKALFCNGIDNTSKDVEAVLDIAHFITCESLGFTINIDMPHKNMANGFEIFRRISSDCKNLFIHKNSNRNTSGKTELELQKWLINSITIGEKINNVIVNLENFKPKLIANLINCNQIENLILVDICRESTNNLAATVSRLATTTNYINSLFVVCPKFRLGWDDFTKRGEKCLKESNYANANFEDTAPLIDSDALSHKARAIFPFKPRRLYCASYELQSIRNWNNWDMIVELTVTHVTGSCPTDLPQFSKFKSLKILSLVILPVFGRLDKVNVENIVGSMKSLNLTRLKIRWFYSRYFNSNIIDGVCELIQNKGNFFSEVVRFEVLFHPDLLVSEYFDFETIKSALLSDSRIVFCIASATWPELRAVVIYSISDLLLYNIKYFYSPCTVDRGLYYFFPYDFECSTGMQHMLELTLG